jgi:putative two-component system response regulator
MAEFNVEFDKQTILIVDDQPNNLKILSSVLGDKYRLYIANSGEKALKILEMTHPDIILLDIMMPEMDGFEVCKRIKSNSRLESIPIIFLTAKNSIDDIIKGSSLGLWIT